MSDDVEIEGPFEADKSAVDYELELKALRAQLAEAEAQFDKAYCVYCGHVGEKSNNAIAEHVMNCAQHPARAVLMENTRVKFERHLLHSALSDLVHDMKLFVAANELDGQMTDKQRETLRLANVVANDWSIRENDDPIIARPVIVCLCGSTRFWREFQRTSLQETLAGKIVLSIGAASGTDDEHFGNLQREEYDRVKTQLDALHLRKVDLADEVLILNVGGYIGESTRREMDYAFKIGRHVRFLEPPPQENFFDAVGADTSMPQAQKDHWLAMEPKPEEPVP